MTSLPALALFRRALSLDGRSLKTYGARAFLAIVLLFSFYSYGDNSRNFYRREAPGLLYFSFITFMNTLLIGLAAASTFAHAITEEKEEGTMGLLRLTRLSSAAIVIGKSGSRLVSALLLLLVQAPFLLLAVTLGGISQEQIFSAYIAIFSFLIMSSGLATLASTICKRSRSASFLTFITLLAYFFLPLAAILLRELGSTSSLLGRLSLALSELTHSIDTSISLTQRLKDCLSISYSIEDNGLFGSIPTILCLTGLTLFLLSIAIFDRFNGSEIELAEDRPFLLNLRSIWQRFQKRRSQSTGAPHKRKDTPAAPLELDPKNQTDDSLQSQDLTPGLTQRTTNRPLLIALSLATISSLLLLPLGGTISVAALLLLIASSLGLYLLINGADGLLSAGRSWTGPSALAWKDFNFLAGGIPLAIAKTVLYCLLFAFIIAMNYTNPYYHRSLFTTIHELAPGLLTTCLVFLVLEAGLLAGRFMRQELNDRTFSSLTLIPHALDTVIFGKIKGCIISLTPIATIALLFFTFNPGEILIVFTKRDGPLVILTMVSFAILFITTCGTISLWLPRGSLALTIVGLWLAHLFLIFLIEVFRFSSGVNEQLVFLMLTLCYLGTTILELIFATARLRTLKTMG